MKIALVHDELIRKGGGEQVCLSFHKAFPEAPIYTSTYNPDLTFSEFKMADVRTSWFNLIARNERQLKTLFFPLGLIAMQNLELDEYEIILISGTSLAKFIKTKAIIINYCFTPFRLAWAPDSYAEFVNSEGLKKRMLSALIKTLKKWDCKAASRTDFFIAMTEETKKRIEIAYNPTNVIEIIPPPVKTNKFKLSENNDNYYLLVSRLEYYKKVDLAIEAFNKLGLKLIVVGKGSKEKELKEIAHDNIDFRSNLSSEELQELYSNCKAFVFPQHEDYGITPLEANSSGKPVIAYGAGGVLTTQIPFLKDPSKATAIFFPSQTVESLSNAVEKFEKISKYISPVFIKSNAENFDELVFVEKIKNFVRKKYLANTIQNSSN
jgi:glycosyltransferase involved in cell wall biosynthesis